MNYSLKKPCNNCPFLRGTPMRLHAERAYEIGEMMLSSNGGEFPCHKTVDYSQEDDDGEDRHIPSEGEMHCAGALAFAEKNGNATQMMRICERLGMYDPSHAIALADKVWDDLDEFVEAMTAPYDKGEDDESK